jgi:prepilin-type N-terminal cleavage/methylation domain-containing protein
MKFSSTGIPAGSRSSRNCSNGQAGFTLLEALVALAVILLFASVVGPHLSQARRIMANAEGRLAAQVLLRSVLDAPVDRSNMTSREGDVGGMHWSIAFEPAARTPSRDKPNWSMYRVIASVTWTPGQFITAETIRLGKVEQ